MISRSKEVLEKINEADSSVDKVNYFIESVVDDFAYDLSLYVKKLTEKSIGKISKKQHMGTNEITSQDLGEWALNVGYDEEDHDVAIRSIRQEIYNKLSESLRYTSTYRMSLFKDKF